MNAAVQIQFVSGCVFVLTKALKMLLDLFFCLVWLRSSSPSCASRTTRGGHLSSSWSRWWKSLRPSFPLTSSPLSLWTSPLSGTHFSGLFSCFAPLSSSLIHVSEKHPRIFPEEKPAESRSCYRSERDVYWSQLSGLQMISPLLDWLHCCCFCYSCFHRMGLYLNML